MDAPFHQIAQNRVYSSLAIYSAHTLELQRHDLDREMRLAAAVVSGMAAMLDAIVDDPQMDRPQRFGQPLFDFGRDRPFRFFCHGFYIGVLDERSTLDLARKT